MRVFAKLIATAGLGMFLVAAATVPGADAQGKDKAVLLLNWYNYGEHAPFYLGLAKGYFAEENIDLEIQEGRGSGITVQAVAAGSAAFGYADTGTMIKAAAKGAPVKAVGVLLQRSPMAVMGFAERNIAAPADIKGKTVAVTPGDSLSQLWPVFLRLNNLSDKDFKTITGDATTKRNAVVNGQADLLLGNANDQKPIIEEATGKSVRALLFADSGVNTLNAGIIVQKDLIQKNPDLIRRFMRAATRAVEATAQAPDEAVAAMLKINAKAGKPETLRKSLDITLPLYHTVATATRRPFDCDPKDMATTLDMLAQYGGVDPSSKGRPEDYYTLEFLPK